MRKLFTLFTALFIAFTAWADESDLFEPLIVSTGFNRDVIADFNEWDNKPADMVQFMTCINSEDFAAWKINDANNYNVNDFKAKLENYSYLHSYYNPDNTDAGIRYSFATESVLRCRNRKQVVGSNPATYSILNPNTGFPDDGHVECLNPENVEAYRGLYWLMGDYSKPNALCLRDQSWTSLSGQLTFKNIGCYEKLYFLLATTGATKTGASRKLNIKVFYSDKSSDNHSFDLIDHSSVAGSENNKYIACHDNWFQGASWNYAGYSNPNSYAVLREIEVDKNKLIDSVQFSNTSTTNEICIVIFAVTGLTAGIAAPEMKEDTEATTELVDNSFNIHWNAVDGATSYRVDVATDEDFHHMVDGYNNETVIHGTDTTISNIGSGTEYYWRVRAVNDEGGQSKSSAPRRVQTSGFPATREDANSIEAEMAALKTAGTETDLTILRTLYKDGYFNTLCLPFDLASLDGTPLAGGELFEFVSATADGENLLEINITPVPGNVVEAGKPYLIRWANTGEVLTTLVFNGVTVTTSTGQSVGEGVQFVGHIGMEQIEYENHYNLFLGENNQLYWPISDGTKMKGFRAYFAIPTGGSTPAPVRRGTPARLTIRSNVPTSVSSIQEQSNIPAKIIENGQLVIIKNGVRYNTTGQQIH